MTELYPNIYRANPVDNFDGDTFRAEVHIWDSLKLNIALRLYGYDTPEMRSEFEKVREAAQQAKEKLETYLMESTGLTVTVQKIDKYGRPVVQARCNYDGGVIDISEEMLGFPGIAQPYYGGKKPNWLEILDGKK